MQHFYKTGLLVLALLAAPAWATKPGNNGEGNGGCGVGQQTNGCGAQGGAGGAGGSAVAGAAAGAIAGAAAGAVAEGGKANATGGTSASRAEGGQAVGTVTTYVEGAHSTYEAPAQAATAYAPNIPQVARSCRLYISFGGSGSSTDRTAGISGGIPLPGGNDQVCLTGFGLEFMTAINNADKAAGRPATFSAEDFRLLGCKVEGMSETSGCKRAADTKRAEGYGLGAPVATAGTSAQYTDPIIRARLGLPPLGK